ncbi:MAG TPA: RNA polymerase factor sigma-54 [Planctomycetes bacterium]|nr:RNA polymerase factor sigma-54 [Planctomycetota bacterium]
MKMEMSRQMRLEQKMMLAPRMIQSMEILQLPILALQERIEHELNNNPVLEIEESTERQQLEESENQPEENFNEKDLVVDSDSGGTEDFERLDAIDEDYKEYMDQQESFRPSRRDEDGDKKLDALKNTEAHSQSLNEALAEQWRLIEADEKVKKAGSRIIDFINDRGYLSVRLEQLHNKEQTEFSMDDLNKALKLVQTLEPPGVGARDVQECLLIQMEQSGEDMSLEKKIVTECMKELLENRLPDIAKKVNCPIEAVNRAVERMSRLDTSPGLQVGMTQNHPIAPDVIVEKDEDTGRFIVRLAETEMPALKINEYYSGMARNKKIGANTREFLKNNIRSAKWIIDAIQQRKDTLLRVTRAIVEFQKEFFENGRQHLKPLPMAKVADKVGVHLATVSRAVAGKYVQCSFGVVTLRKFFSGGTEDDSGNSHSWEAVRAKLQQIIDSEDKSKPLSDDQIREKLAEQGIKNLARRTVAKYRKLMDIPAARFRKKY